MIGKLLKYFYIIIPFIYFNNVLDASGTPRILFLSFFLFLSYFLCYIKNVKLSMPPHLITLFYVSYIFVIFLSSQNSVYIDVIEIIKRVEYFFFLILIFNTKSKFDSKEFLKGYFYFTCIIILFGLIELFFILVVEKSIDNFYAISASFSHKNIYSSVLLLSTPFLFVYQESKFWKSILLLLILTLLIILQTRSVLLAFFISSLYYSINSFNDLRKNIYLIIFTILITSILGVFFLNKLGTINDFVNILEWNNTSSLRSSTIIERFFLWHHSFKMFLDHWFLGVGLSAWPIYFPVYGLTLWRLRQGEVIMQRPHNDVIENFNELGLLGGCIFLVILFYPLIIKSNIRKKNVINFGLLSFIVISLFSFPQERIIPSLIFFSLITFKLKKSSSLELKKPFLFFLSFFLLLTSCLVFSKLNSEILFKRYISHKNIVNSKDGIKLLTNARSKLFLIDKTTTPIDWYIGELYFKEKKIEVAESHFNKALHINPFHIHVLNSLGGCSIYKNDFVKAKSYFEQAIKIAPFFELGLYNQAYCLSELSQKDEAIKVLKNINDKKSKKFIDRSLLYAKSIISLKIREVEKTDRAIINSIFLNDKWILSIIHKSYKNKNSFSHQLSKDLDFIRSFN